MLRAVPVPVSVAFICFEFRVRSPTRLSVSSIYQQSQSFHRARPRSIKHKLASDMRRDAPPIDTCVECYCSCHDWKPTIRKSIPTNGYGIAREFSRTKPINSTSWTYLLQVHGIVLPDWDVRTNTRGLATFTA